VEGQCDKSVKPMAFFYRRNYLPEALNSYF